MVEKRGQKIRVVLRAIQILDRKEPFYKPRGEFRFEVRITPVSNGETVVETRIPETGCYYLTDAPGHNRIRLDMPIFEGVVEDHLGVELRGLELDKVGKNDELNPYKRIFSGSPDAWVGSYGPHDEHPEPEDVGDWKIWYEIERV